MRAPSAKLLAGTFRDLTLDGANLIRRLAELRDEAEELKALVNERCRATADYVAQLRSNPYTSAMWRTTVVLHAVNVIIGGHGVEPLGRVEMAGPPFEYVNLGDPYVATLVYKRESDNLYISTYGGIVEAYPHLCGD